MTRPGDYFGLGGPASLLLAIFPPTSMICGIITRLAERKPLAALLRIPFALPVWMLDLGFMISSKHIVRAVTR